MTTPHSLLSTPFQKPNPGPLPNLIKTMNPLCLRRFTALATLATLVCLHSMAYGQSSRTWVSGVGDDANPGSRTAPCKTFAGAISKTAAAGEISVLDPGGYGAVTITKAITIDGSGTIAGITASGVNAIIVNAGTNDMVILRHLIINGLGTGLAGVRVLSARAVLIENCAMTGGTTAGVDLQASATSTNTTVYVINSRISDFGFTGTGAGILVRPTVPGGKVVVVNSTIQQCAVGIDSRGEVTLTSSTVSGNRGAGLTTSAGGLIKTYHDNRIFGNSPDGNPTGSLPLR